MTGFSAWKAQLGGISPLLFSFPLSLSTDFWHLLTAPGRFAFTDSSSPRTIASPESMIRGVQTEKEYNSKHIWRAILPVMTLQTACVKKAKKNGSFQSGTSCCAIFPCLATFHACVVTYYRRFFPGRFSGITVLGINICTCPASHSSSVEFPEALVSFLTFSHRTIREGTQLRIFSWSHRFLLTVFLILRVFIVALPCLLYFSRRLGQKKRKKESSTPVLLFFRFPLPWLWLSSVY